MNVIISNRYATMLQQLDIDIIKSLSGEFEVDEIVSTFQNFYFQRMILDITAIKDYQDIKNLQKLSIALDMDKVILLLDDSLESSSNEYLSKLISMGIYNFTKNAEGVMYLYNNPNSYRDVAHIHQLENMNESSGESGDNQKIIVNNVVTQVHQVKIIGFKNITEDAGATTLVYMLKKQLEKNYQVVGIEVDRRDFMFFNDKDLVSTTTNELNGILAKYSGYDVILIDVNKSVAAEGICNEIFYLIEPSTIKLNKLMLVNNKVLDVLKNKKVVLNKSVLSSKDVLDFEYESRLKVCYNIPPLDDREKNIMALNKFLVRLGFDKQQDEEHEKKNKILGLFG
ncbi:MAG: hypothetical protein E7169_04315 [Firmicutes bacterium]|nr:hypothetical protein [Bacillota bacterium]